MSQMHSCFHTRHWSIYPLCRNGQMHRFKFEVFPISYNICMSWICSQPGQEFLVQKCLLLKHLCAALFRDFSANALAILETERSRPVQVLPGYSNHLDTAIIEKFSQTDQVSLRWSCLSDQKCHRWDQKLGNLGSIHQMPYCKMVYRSIGSQGKQIKRITFKGRVERVERVCHVCVLASLLHWHGTNLGSEQLLKICAPSGLTCPSRWDLTNCQPMSSEFPW